MYEGVIGAGEEAYCGFARESYQIACIYAYANRYVMFAALVREAFFLDQVAVNAEICKLTKSFK